jgi:hypothetical protein
MPSSPRRIILASHLIFTGYAHWLSNDPRGSGSTETRKEELKELGGIHAGRKAIQPPRDDLRRFFREAEPKLDHHRMWFGEEMRTVIGSAIGAAVAKRGYALWGCAVCSNHAHVVARTHRDRSEVIWEQLACAARDVLRAAGMVPAEHPVWSHRPYKVFLYIPDEVRQRIAYVEQNPVKEGLPQQHWEFVQPYRG